MTLQEVAVYYESIRTKFREVLFNTYSGLGLEPEIKTLNYLVEQDEDKTGRMWDSTYSYNEGDICTDDNLFIYTSLIDGNINNEPFINTSSWKRARTTSFEDGKYQINASGQFSFDFNEPTGDLIKYGNGFSVKRLDSKTLEVIFDSSANIKTNKYLVLFSGYGTYGYVGNNSAFDIKKEGFKILIKELNYDFDDHKINIAVIE